MHFVLVHGAYHGAWCWTTSAPRLSVAATRPRLSRAQVLVRLASR